MGVYIKGMEMPKERESFTVTIKYNGLVFDTETGIQVAEAQEVPPHGRLIDADALIKVLKTKAKHPLNIETTPYSWAFAYECLADVVGDMPTIIPAEEGE